MSPCFIEGFGDVHDQRGHGREEAERKGMGREC